jgi:hypothetical protein
MIPETIGDAIIPVHNQFSVVGKCIEPRLSRFEIIVIDDASNEQELTGYLNSFQKNGAIT